MNQINSFLSSLKRIYSQQGQVGKILLPALFLLVFCCLCSILISLFPRSGSSDVLPTPNILPADGTQVTPTPLFDFDFPTFTPFPTLTAFVPTAFPTLTPPPTETQAPTQIAPTVTATPIPSETATPVPPTATRVRSIVIMAVHKTAENVDIQNVSSTAVDLNGWRLVSETGNQSCDLSGTLAPNEVLRIWANRGPGFDCRFASDIWLDSEADAAVLYDPQGQEVSRYP